MGHRWDDITNDTATIEEVDGGVRVTFQRNNQGIPQESTQKSSEKNHDGSEKNHGIPRKSTDINKFILDAIKLNEKISVAEIAMQLGLSARAVEKRIKTMREIGVIQRIGPDKGGYWEIISPQ